MTAILLTPAELAQVIEVLESAAMTKCADGTYFDKDCKATMALTMLRAKVPQEPIGWLSPIGVYSSNDDLQYLPNWSDYYVTPLYEGKP
jgi:hypothetical protein